MITNYCNTSRAIEEHFDGEPLLQPCSDGRFITAHQACFQARVYYANLDPQDPMYQEDPGCDCACHGGLPAIQEMERMSRSFFIRRTLTTV